MIGSSVISLRVWVYPKHHKYMTIWISPTPYYLFLIIWLGKVGQGKGIKSSSVVWNAGLTSNILLILIVEAHDYKWDKYSHDNKINYA